jgi:Lon protease-like protein
MPRGASPLAAGGGQDPAWILPEIIPVFPLPGVLLLPGGRLPLNIFEPRYVAMIDDALGAPQRAIGMIQPLDAERGQVAPDLYPIGCLGRITSFAEHDAGRYRYLITLTGMCRFTIREEMAEQRGYRRMRVDFDPWRGDLDAQAGAAGVDRDEMLRIIKRYFKTNDISADWEAIADTPDDRLITTLAMVCPFSANEKQALLEAPDPGARARTLMALMEMAALRGGESDDRPRH